MALALSPLERRWLFSELLAKWILEAKRLGYRVEICEAGVLEQRRSRWGIPFTDGVHKRASRHYERCAADPILHKQLPSGEWVRLTDGDDPAWVEMGEIWENLHEACRWGGRFRDANHLSIVSEDGRA